MELKGTKTEKNLMEAFAGESMARNKYTFFASVARKEGYEQLAAIFEETAGNEKEHAKLWFKALCGGAIPDTMTCLEMAASGENDEWTEMYPRMAAEAKEEGFASLTGGLRAAEQAQNAETTATTVQLVSVWFSVAIAVLLTYAGSVGMLSVAAVLMYQAAWSALSIAVCALKQHS